MLLRRASILLLAVPVLAACGGDSDEDQISDIIKKGATDPSSVCDNATDKVLKQVGGSVEACQKAAKASSDQNSGEPKDLEVEVDGAKATARFKDEDGDNDLRFVKDGDTWKLDAVR